MVLSISSGSLQGTSSKLRTQFSNVILSYIYNHPISNINSAAATQQSGAVRKIIPNYNIAQGRQKNKN
jgi:hypothetical protein